MMGLIHQSLDVLHCLNCILIGRSYVLVAKDDGQVHIGNAFDGHRRHMNENVFLLVGFNQ
jgi:hypothetical protein